MEWMEWFVLAVVLMFVAGILWMKAEITSPGLDRGTSPGESESPVALDGD